MWLVNKLCYKFLIDNRRLINSFQSHVEIKMSKNLSRQLKNLQLKALIRALFSEFKKATLIISHREIHCALNLFKKIQPFPTFGEKYNILVSNYRLSVVHESSEEVLFNIN